MDNLDLLIKSVARKRVTLPKEEIETNYSFEKINPEQLDIPNDVYYYDDSEYEEESPLEFSNTVFYNIRGSIIPIIDRFEQQYGVYLKLPICDVTDVLNFFQNYKGRLEDLLSTICSAFILIQGTKNRNANLQEYDPSNSFVTFSSSESPLQKSVEVELYKFLEDPQNYCKQLDSGTATKIISKYVNIRNSRTYIILLELFQYNQPQTLCRFLKEEGYIDPSLVVHYVTQKVMYATFE